MVSDVMADYVKTIYTRQIEHGPPISTSAIADSLSKTPATVASMLGKLEERGLIEREKYTGVEVTDEVQTVALEVIRHHRLLETYLSECLDYEWNEIHDEADALEHHISETFERRIAEILDDPEVDPHGDPIPNTALDPVGMSDSSRLSEQSVGDRLVVTRVRDRDEIELEYLAEVGIIPGSVLEVVDIAPFGMVTVQFESSGKQALPEPIGEFIYVQPAETPDEPTAENGGAQAA